MTDDDGHNRLLNPARAYAARGKKGCLQSLDWTGGLDWTGLDWTGMDWTQSVRNYIIASRKWLFAYLTL